jgi:uncharacterized Zn-finger protein
LGLYFPVNVDTASDCDSGFSNHTSLFFSGIVDTTYHPPLLSEAAWLSECLDFSSIDSSGSAELQQSTPASSGTTSHSNGLRSCSPMPAPGPFRDWSLPTAAAPSRAILPALRRLKCSQCPQTFIEQRQLNRHLNTHKSVACDVEGCASLLKDQRTLKRHKQTIHRSSCLGQQSTCDLCGREFPRADNFKRHITTCQGVKKRKT